MERQTDRQRDEMIPIYPRIYTGGYTNSADYLAGDFITMEKKSAR